MPSLCFFGRTCLWLRIINSNLSQFCENMHQRERSASFVVDLCSYPDSSCLESRIRRRMANYIMFYASATLLLLCLPWEFIYCPSRLVYHVKPSLLQSCPRAYSPPPILLWKEYHRLFILVFLLAFLLLFF